MKQKMLNARAASVSPTNFTRQKEIETGIAVAPLRQAGAYKIHCASPSGVSSKAPALIVSPHKRGWE